jgi:hypothetical protein
MSPASFLNDIEIILGRYLYNIEVLPKRVLAFGVKERRITVHGLATMEYAGSMHMRP